LTATQKRIAELKAAQAKAQADAAAKNLTSTGLVLDTNKPVIGGQTNIPASNYLIRGGKAIPRGAEGPNITISKPSILTKDRGRIYADTPGISETQRRALEIMAGQHAATYRTAQAVSSERTAQELLGKSREEAQRIATQGSEDERVATPHFGTGQISLGKQEANFVNTALQTQEVRANAARLAYANQLIQTQTDTNRELRPGATTELDDLKSLLESAPGQTDPVSNILVTTDENGDPMSPRNIKLQIENALLTGSDPGILNLDVAGTGGVAPNLESIAQAVDASFDDLIPGGLRDTTTTSIGEDGSLSINFAESLGPELRQQFGEIFLETLGQYFDLKGQGIDQLYGQDGIKINFPGGPDGGSIIGGDGSLIGEEGNPLGFLEGLLGNPILLLVIIGVAALIGGVLLFRK
jgi:hypothetical protein